MMKYILFITLIMEQLKTESQWSKEQKEKQRQKSLKFAKQVSEAL